MISEKIIERYLKGKATKDELDALKTYLAGKDLSVLKDQMAKDWSDSSDWDSELPKEISDDMLRSIKQKMAARKVPVLKRKRAMWLGAAAAVMLLIGISLTLWMKPTNQLLVHQTAFGEWKTLELPDGSSVKLNANSEISFASTWVEGSDRQVWLKGEAFFKVEKKPATNAKFKVFTENLQVEVLGTSFNVSSRGSRTDVFLEEGLIRLELGDREETLNPGDFLAYSKEEDVILERHNETTTELHTSWKDGVLELKDKSIEEILLKIEEIYGVKTKVLKPSLLKEVKTVSVPMDKLEVALPVLEGTFGTQIIIRDNQLIIQ